MAIVENRSTEQGDVILIRPEVPIVGLLSLLSFTDNTVGEGATDFFNKEFRYSVNGGVTFSTWQDLSTLNIQDVRVSQKDKFMIEYRYTRVGNTGELEFNDINVGGTFERLKYPTYDTLPPKTFFEIDDPNVFGWALNVLEKLYSDQLLPEYIERGVDSRLLEDEDFVSFWFSITTFFAVWVYYGRQFESLTTNDLLLRAFVEGRGLFTCSDVNLEGLNYLTTNLFEEHRKRGTRQIFRRKGGSVPVDGELLRLLCFVEINEFLFALTQRGEMGWCLGNSSPMFAGSTNIINLNKSYEFTREVEELTKYPLLSSGNITLEERDGVSMMRVDGTVGLSGVGDLTQTDKLIPVDRGIAYEIGFRVISDNLNEDIEFGVFAFDRSKNLVNLQSVSDGSTSNLFLQNYGLNKIDQEYQIRAVVFEEGKDLDPEDSLLIGSGNNLRFTEEVEFIMPFIRCNGSVKLFNSFDVRPLKLPISRGFLSPKNFTFAYLKNNGELINDIAEIEINDKLIPYDQFLKIKWL